MVLIVCYQGRRARLLLAIIFRAFGAVALRVTFEGKPDSNGWMHVGFDAEAFDLAVERRDFHAQ